MKRPAQDQAVRSVAPLLAFARKSVPNWRETLTASLLRKAWSTEKKFDLVRKGGVFRLDCCDSLWAPDRPRRESAFWGGFGLSASIEVRS